MTPTDLFHAHLSECQQCRDNPRDLCRLGEELGIEVVAKMVEKWKEENTDELFQKQSSEGTYVD